MKIFSYRNLHKKGVVWSLKNVKTGLVVGYATTALFKDVELKVSQAGRKRVLQQQRKNVHAGVKGVLVKRLPANLKWIRARYNPYETETFTDMQGNPILTAKYAKLNKKGLWVVL